MAYIQPTSNILILKDVPLNASYDDTFTFKDLDTQYNYFKSKAKFELINYSVVRDRTNALKVEGDIAEYYDVNYIMFNNSNFKNSDGSDKWFYAFIIDTEYVNPNTTILIFQIDVMQSWMFDYTILPSLVEREHVYDDSLYANLVPENIQVNERIPFSQPFNTNKYIGSKILVMGFTENPYDYVYYNPPKETIPYDPSAILTPDYIIYNISSNNVSSDKIYYDYTEKAFLLYEDNIESFTFYIKWFIKGTEQVWDRQKKRCRKIDGKWEIDTIDTLE